MELRHLDTLVAIDDEGTFTAAADSLRTVQSNVSDQVRQLESELGVTLLARGRGGATATESGRVVLARARRIRREIDLLHEELAALQGLQVGNATFGVVGTASRWLVPQLVEHLAQGAPGVRLLVHEGASERLLGELVTGELALAVVTAPAEDPRRAARAPAAGGPARVLRAPRGGADGGPGARGDRHRPGPVLGDRPGAL